MQERQRRRPPGFTTLIGAGVLALAGASLAQTSSPGAVCGANPSQHAADQHWLDLQVGKCTAVIAQHPRSAPTFYNRGRARYHEGQDDDPLADYDTATTLR